MDPVRLKAETLESFSHVPRPAKAEITSHDCDECNSLSSDFWPYFPSDLPLEVLDSHVFDLPLLTDEAKQFYLPAWILRSIDRPVSNYTDALLMELNTDHRWFPTPPYTKRQWTLIESYLEYVERLGVQDLAEPISKAKERLSVLP